MGRGVLGRWWCNRLIQTTQAAWMLGAERCKERTCTKTNLSMNKF